MHVGCSFSTAIPLSGGFTGDAGSRAQARATIGRGPRWWKVWGYARQHFSTSWRGVPSIGGVRDSAGSTGLAGGYCRGTLTGSAGLGEIPVSTITITLAPACVGITLADFAQKSIHQPELLPLTQPTADFLPSFASPTIRARYTPTIGNHGDRCRREAPQEHEVPTRVQPEG